MRFVTNVPYPETRVGVRVRIRVGTLASVVALLMGLCGSALALGAGQAEDSYEYFSFACADWHQSQPASGDDTQGSGAGVCLDVYESSSGQPAYVVSAGRGSCIYDEASGRCEWDSVSGYVSPSDVVFDSTSGVVTITTQIRDCTIDVVMALPDDDSSDHQNLSPDVETRENQLRAYYQHEAHVTNRSGTGSGSVCGWAEATGDAQAFLFAVSVTDHYLYVDTTPAPPTLG